MKQILSDLPLEHFKVVPKKWGMEIWLVNGPYYCAKYLYLEPGWECSLHKHTRKDETFIIIAGSCFLEYTDSDGAVIYRTMRPGTQQHIPPGTYHRFSNPRYAPMCIILEVSTHHDENDVTRKDESQMNG